MKTNKMLSVGVLMAVMTLAACGPKHTHTPDDIWHNDEAKHWHECTGCHEKVGEADHVFGQVEYSWDNDHKCTAVKECTVCEYEFTVQTVQGVYVKDTDATCLVNEKGHYKAEFTVEGLVDQQTPANSVEKEDTATGHKFGGQITYTWVGDQCTASWNCEHTGCNEKQTETVTGVYVKDTEATCIANEKGHYLATFTTITEFGTAQTAKDSVERPDSKKPHNFGGTVTYDWDEDECTASRKCQTAGCNEVESETKKADYVKDTDATCTSNEKGHYVVVFDNTALGTAQTEKDSVEKPDSKKDHDLDLVEGQEPTADADGWKDYYQCDSCKKYFADEDGEEEITDLDAWKTGDGALYKLGKVSVPVNAATNWSVVANAPARVDWGSGVGSHSQAAQFRNYQYFDWKESQLGIEATYDNGGATKVTVNKLSYVFYLFPDAGGSGITGADLTVKAYVVDNLDNKVLVDNFVISKDDTYEPWTPRVVTFEPMNFAKLVIETKSEFLTLPASTGFNNKFYVDNLELDYAKTDYPTGDVAISTTEGTNWSYTSKEGTCKLFYGVMASTPKEEGTGPYINFRNYQWTDWKESQVGIDATYTIPESDIKTVNTLAFTAYMSNAVSDCKTTIKIIDALGNIITIVDKAYNLNAVTPESFTFDECAVTKILITTKAFTEGKSGDSNLFLKEFSLSYAAE